MFADYQTRVDQIAQVPQVLFPGAAPMDYGSNRDANIREAIRRYSKKRPRICTWAIQPTGVTFEYMFAPGTPWIASSPQGSAAVVSGSQGTGIEGWNGDQFRVRRLVYPYGYLYGYQNNEITPEFWRVYVKPDGNVYIQFAGLIPAPNFSCGMEFTAPNSVLDVVATNSPAAGQMVTITLPSTRGILPNCQAYIHDTHGSEYAQIFSYVPGRSITVLALQNSYTTPTVSVDTIQCWEHPSDVDPLCRLAASLLMMSASNYYADQQKSVLRSDPIDYGAKSAQWSRRAQEELKTYEAHMRATQTGTGTNLTYAGTAFGGGEYLFKRKLWTT